MDHCFLLLVIVHELVRLTASDITPSTSSNLLSFFYNRLDIKLLKYKEEINVFNFLETFYTRDALEHMTWGVIVVYPPGRLFPQLYHGENTIPFDEMGTISLCDIRICNVLI